MNMQLLKIKTLLIIFFFIGTLCLCVFNGTRHRRYASPPVMYNARDNVEIFSLWEKENVKHRILYLFDRRLNASPDGSFITNENYIDHAIRKGIIRKVYHIVPGAAWTEVQNTLKAISSFKYSNGIYISPMPEGRLYVTTLDKIKPDQERALVVINRESWNAAETETINEILNRQILKSDLVAFHKN